MLISDNSELGEAVLRRYFLGRFEKYQSISNPQSLNADLDCWQMYRKYDTSRRGGKWRLLDYHRAVVYAW